MENEELCLICWARGRGGMNFGLGPFSSCSLKSGGDYDAERNNNSRNGGKGVSSLRHGGGWSGIGGLYHKMTVANSKTGHSVHMRGLPFKATMDDVSQFFAPLIPVDIRLLYESNTGRPNGKCDVDFPTHSDAETAMRKDKQNMGHRYIELFLKSTVHGNSSVSWSNDRNNDNNKNNFGIGVGRGDGNSFIINSSGGGRTPSKTCDGRYSYRGDNNNNTYVNGSTSNTTLQLGLINGLSNNKTQRAYGLSDAMPQHGYELKREQHGAAGNDKGKDLGGLF